MNFYLLLMGIVIVICVLMHRFTEKLQVPSLLIFIGLGMCFGTNGIFKIPYDDYAASEVICSVSLIFVMFYGGFGTNMKAAKPVAVQAFCLSTIGVAATAGLTGTFVHFVLGLPWMESMLIGSVVSSTDAASVFNILRSKKLNLKYNTASLLELESGSNDPMSYMLTVVLISLMQGEAVSVPVMLLQQLLLGAAAGLLLGKAAIWLLNHISFDMQQGETILIFAIVILAYALPNAIGGNGYLSAYLCGILMGNSYFQGKRNLVHFFDVLTGVAQMIIFFLLGLLVTPVQLPAVIVPSLLIMVFMTFVGRPAAIAAILFPFKTSLRQIGLVSWAGLRGVASIVFAILAVLGDIPLRYNLFNLVFCIVLFSLAVQGSLLPYMSRKLGMIDEHADVLRTFTDYQEDNDIAFIKISVGKNHEWESKRLKEIPLPPEILVVMIMRGEKNMVPNGDTQIQEGDLLVIAAREFEDRENLELREVAVDKAHKWKNKTLSEAKLPEGTLVVLVQREGQTIIPSGNTVIQEGDLLVEARF